jgi:tetratricopeptide (TPR) repeat protein
MQYFEAEDYNTVITLLLECNKNKNLTEETRQNNDFFLNISYGLVGDFEKIDVKLLEDKAFDDNQLALENTILSCSVLLNFYASKQHYDKAIEFNDRLLSIAKQHVNIESDSYAKLLINLSVLHSYVGNYAKALELGEQVLNIREKILGKNHPDYAATLSFLSNYYSSLGDYSKALDFGNKALNIQKQVLGENNHEYATTLSYLSKSYTALGDYSKAIEYALLALNVYEQSLGNDHPLFVTSLNNLSQNYSKLGKFPEAIELAQKALRIQAKVLGRTHSDYALSLNNLANLYSSMGDYSKAVELGEEALSVFKSVFGENHPNYATSLNNLALYYSSLGDYSKAIELGEEALTIRKNVFGENHPDYALSLNNLANLYSSMGDYSKAVELGEEALSVFKSVFGENHPDYALSLNTLANLYSSMGDYSKAIELTEEALNIRKNILGENHPDYALSLNNLANYYSEIGDYSKTIEFGQQASKIFKNIYGENHPDYALSLNNLSGHYSTVGNYYKAIELGQQAANIFKQVFGENHSNYAQSLNNLAYDYFKIGNYSKAIELGHLALSIRKQVLGDNHHLYATSLGNLSIYYSELGNYAVAMELSQSALGILKRVLGEEHPDYALSLNNLAHDYSLLGDYSKAIELGEEALNIQKKVLGENHPDYALSLNNLANYYSSLGDYYKSIAMNEEALNIRKNILGENHPDYISTLYNLAVSFLYSNNFIKSSEYLTATFEKQKVQLQNQFGWLTENERSLYWYKKQNIFLLTPSFSYLSGNISQFVNLSYDGALLSKALMLNSSIELNNLLMETGNEKVIDKVSRLRTLHHTLNKLYEKPISERHLDTDSLEEVSQKLERELLSESKEYGDYTRFMSVTWQDVQKRLEVQDVAIEFVEFPVLKSDSVMYAALVLRKDWEQPQMIPLFEKRDLEKFLAQTPDRLYSGYVGKQLYRLMWKPLEGVVKKGDNVYFSAAGVYYQLALEYLPSDDDIPLCDKYNFRRLSSTRQLALDQQEATNGNATLYGGIEYDVNPLEMVVESKRYRQDKNLYAYRGVSMDSLREGSWVSLDNTVPEIEFISDELNKSQIEARIFTGVKANEESIKALSGKRTSILHLATHGFFLPVEETRRINYFQMLGKENNAAPDMSMRRSGLIMAGGNRAWSGDTIPEGIDDGILTAQEISVLDFRGMDLVVLSACETGLGDINGSEGVFGLQRAFKKAGASTLVMSLWKVNDQVTRLLMGKFYQGLMEGKTKHAAFLEAQQLIRSRHPEPQNWAAFVMLD